MKLQLTDVTIKQGRNRYMAEHEGKPPGNGKDNQDNSSNFRAFKLTALPPGFIVLSSESKGGAS